VTRARTEAEGLAALHTACARVAVSSARVSGDDRIKSNRALPNIDPACVACCLPRSVDFCV